MSTRNLSYFLQFNVLAYYVTDLWSAGAERPEFLSLLPLWSISTGIDSLQYAIYCNDDRYYAGLPNHQILNGYFERTYRDLATHDIIYFGMVIAAGGSWQATDTFSIQFDDQPARSFQLYPATMSSHATSILCDLPNNYPAAGMQSVGKVYHTASSVTLRISWNFATNNSPVPPFLAIRDIKLLFGTKTPADSQEMYIALGDTTISYSTRCAFDFYWDSTNGCTHCSSPCFNCFGSSATQCYSSSYLYVYNGVSSVGVPGNCRFSDPVTGKCVTCLGGQTLGPDSSCTTNSCPYPYAEFTVGAASRCINPCSSNQFMMWDYTCTNTCDPPLVYQSDTNGPACSYPCPQSEHIFLHWSGSCVQTCSHHKRIEKNNQFCDACQPDYYLYDNDLCFKECYPGFGKESIGGSHFCHFPCSSDQYLYPDGSCQNTCTESFKRKSGETFNICNLGLSSNEKSQVRKISELNKILNTIQPVISCLITISSSANLASIFMNILTIMPGYIKYFQINYPEKLQYLLDSNDVLSLHLIPDLPPKAVALFPSHELPANFGKAQLPSSFFVNFWGSSIILATFSVVLLLAYILESCTKKYKVLGKLCTKVKEALKWNFLLALLISKFSEVILFSSFEFESIDINNIWGIISFLECLVISSLSLFVLIRIFYLVIARSKILITNATPSITPSNDEDTRLTKWQNYTVLYESFKEKSLMHQMFVPLSLLRVCVFSIIIAYFYHYPLAQTCSIVMLNLLMLLYISKVKPSKRVAEVVEYAVQEVVLLIINTCVMVLAALDKAGMEASTERTNLGSVIIWVNVGFSGATTLYLILKTLVQIIRAIRGWRSRRCVASQIFQNQREAVDNSTANLVDSSSLSTQKPSMSIEFIQDSNKKLVGGKDQSSQSVLQLESLDNQREQSRPNSQYLALEQSHNHESESPGLRPFDQISIREANNMSPQRIQRNPRNPRTRINQEHYTNQDNINLPEYCIEGYHRSIYNNGQMTFMETRTKKRINGTEVVLETSTVYQNRTDNKEPLGLEGNNQAAIRPNGSIVRRDSEKYDELSQ